MTLRALVLDDSSVMRSMLMRSLTSIKVADFEFTEAEDGVVGLSKFSPDNTDIIFADWNMPNMTGIDFVRKIRANKKADHIPIIMVTSEKTMGKMEIALDSARATAYICKPFTPDQLARKLAPIIAGMGSSEQAEAAKPKGGFFSKLMKG